MIADFLYRRSGLAINYDKLYLLENRLTPMLKGHDIEGVKGLAAHMRKNIISTELADAVTEAMTTNETMFFRDQKPFNQLRDIVLPALVEKGVPTIRIWSAACSQGQEPYSIAMLLDAERHVLDDIPVHIIATDIAQNILERAKRGVYTQFEVQRGLPIKMLMKHFTQCANAQWQISDAMRDRVQFEYGNLLEEQKPAEPYHIIMCRNVLIYFDEETREAVLRRIAGVLAKGGYLFLGSSETILGKSEDFTAVSGCPGLFTRN